MDLRIETPRARRRWLRWSAPALLLVAGCNAQRQPDYSGLGLVEATGTVRMDDQPLAGANLVFFNQGDGKACAFATTDANGRYRMMYDSRQPGVPPGKKIVRISLGPLEDDEQVTGASAATTAIPARYNTKSQLTVEVTDSGNQQFDFDLESKE